MRMAARELVRRPRGFLVPMAILALLALLLLYPAAILDGLMLESTAGMRTAPGDLLTYADSANGVMLRSFILPQVRDQVDAVPRTAKVQAFDIVALPGTVEGRPEPTLFSAMTSDQPLGGRAPGPGEALADITVQTRLGVRQGARLVLGLYKVPVTIVGFTTGTNLAFTSGLVLNRQTWLQAVTNATQDQGSQALLITVDTGAKPIDVAAAVDRATGGATQTMTIDRAVQSIPGIGEQQATFGYMRAITLVVALVVVALFLSFMTLERAPLYATLKALGAASKQLFLALVAQVLLITSTAVAIAALLTFGFTKLPTPLPTVMQAGRVIEAAVALVLTAVIGSSLSLRRVVNVDAADAIG